MCDCVGSVGAAACDHMGAVTCYDVGAAVNSDVCWRGVKVRAAMLRKVGAMGHDVCYDGLQRVCGQLPCSNGVTECLRRSVSMRRLWENV